MAIGSVATPTTSLARDLDRGLAGVSQMLRAAAGSRRSVTALLTLRRLSDEGPQRIGDLAAAERVAQPTMTVLLRRLEDEGLVERAADPDDARAVLVAVTEAGREELESVRAARAAHLDARLRALTPDQRDALAAALPVLEILATP